MPTSVCPPREELERLLDERLAPADLSRVSAHVADCPGCQKALETLTAGADSELPSWPGQAADDSTPPSPGFLDRIKQAPPPAPRPARAAGEAAEPPSDGDVILAYREEAEPFPTLDDYEILGVLGRGGEGVVYKARHRPLGRTVALKMLHADQGPQALARFRLEAETLARLRHPNIVQVYEVGSAAGRPFFAMEYVEGGSLSLRLHGQPQPAGDSAALVEALARAVHAAHQADVVHRDLKPANVLLACGPAGKAFGVPKISDFGIAKRVQVDAGLTRTGMVLGTPGYMAPEQARAEGKDVGPASDVYALGSILYHLLTGRPPFVGPRPMEVLLQVVHEEPVSLRRLFPQTPRDLETICLKCLHKEPRRRYASAEALADDLRRYLDGRPVLARPSPAWERAWKAARRRPVIAALAAVSALALVLLLGGGLYYNARLASALQASDDNLHDARIARKRADDEAADAQAARKKADDEAALAHTAEQAAVASAAQAQRRGDLALDAYQKLIHEVQDTLDEKDPATRPMRKSLLATAAAGLKELAKDADTAAPSRAGAEAHLKMGRLLYDISDDEAAAAQFEACRNIAEGLAKADPLDAQVRNLLCVSYAGLGNLAKRAGRPREATDYFGREAGCAKPWLDDEPDSPEARERLAESYDWLAGEAPKWDDPGAYEKYNDLLLALVEQWVKADPDNPQARFYGAATQDRCGRIRMANGDPVGARDCFLKSNALITGLVAEDAKNPKYGAARLAASRQLTAVYVQLGEPAKALPFATFAADAFHRTLASRNNDPENVEYGWMAGDAFTVRASVLMRLMRHEEAAREINAAVQVFRLIEPHLKPGPIATNVRQRLAQSEEELQFCKDVATALNDPSWALRQPPAACQDLLVVRVCLLTQQGRPDEAAKAADLVDGLKPADAEECLSLAGFIAGDLGGLAPGKGPDEYTDAERTMRRRLLDRAVASLNQAADLGFKDAARIKKDGDLYVLHAAPGWDAVIARLERRP